MADRNFSYSQIQALANICQMAASHYRDNAETFKKLVDYKPDPNAAMQIHGASAQALADTFTAQAEMASAFSQLFGAGESMRLDYDAEAVEEEFVSEAIGR